MNARNRFKRWVSLGLALGALATPAALAGTRPDDRAGQRGVDASTAVQSLATRPDDRAGALGVGTQSIAADTSDVVSRYLRTHSTGSRPGDRTGALGVGSASAVVPDVFERYAAAHRYGSGLNDAAAARTVSLTGSAGFNWGDYGAGVGTGIGVILLLAAGLMATPVWRREHTQNARHPQSAGGVG
jgi:hypothetical protein